MVQRSVFLIALVVLTRALLADEIPEGCRSEISLSLKPDHPDIVVVHHNDIGRLRIDWRGGSSEITPFYNPLEIQFDRTCQLQSETATLTPSKCAYVGDPKTISIPAPDTDPTIDVETKAPWHTIIDIHYSMPNATNQRRIRGVFLGNNDVIIDKSIGGTEVDNYEQAAVLGEVGPVLIKAIACGTKTASGTTGTAGDTDCNDDCGGKCDAPEQCVGSPVNTSGQNMRYEDTDPLPGYPLHRFYDSRRNQIGFFGSRWFSVFDADLKIFDDFDGLRYVTVTAPDRSWMVFEGYAGSYRQIGPGRARDARLVRLPDGTWRQTLPGGRESRDFNAAGNLVAVRDVSSGRETRFVWSGGLPVRVEDSWGNWALTITTNLATRRITDIAPDGRPDLAWHYTHDDHLQQVDSPLGVWRTYEYAMYGVPYDRYRLTVARDGAGNVIESHDYSDDSGRATTSYGPGGEIESITVGDGRAPRENATTIRYRNGRTEIHYQRAVAGRWRTVEVLGGCASCGQRNQTVVYDQYANVVRAQAADGYITTMVYGALGLRKIATTTAQRPATCDPATDGNHCRLTTDALATVSLEPTAASVLTLYSYADANWPDRITAVTTSSVRMFGQLRRELVTYHPVTGDVLTRTVSGWTGTPAHEESRTTVTTLYDGSEGAAFAPGGAFLSAWLALPQPARAKTVDGPRTDVSDVTTLVYYPIDAAVPAGRRGQLAAVRNALGHVTRFENYDAFGNAQRVTDANGVVTDMAYDALGRRTAMTTRAATGCDTSADPLCATDLTAVWNYAAAGPLATAQQPGGGVTSYGYDARGRLASMSRGPSAADLRERVETTYDPDTGRKNAEVVFAREGAAWVEKRRLAYGYDTFEELATVTYPGNASVGYQYDAAGRLSAQRDENHLSPNTRYGYDPAGRLREVQQTLGPGFVTTTYAYDLHGNLTAVTDPNGNVTSYVYDDFGQILSQQSPVSGTTTYEYDRAGNLRRMTDANGATTLRTYDAANRPLTAISTRVGETETVAWTYDAATAGVYGVGRLAAMDDPAGRTTYAYDRRGLLREERRTFQSTTHVQTYAWDLDGNRTSIGYPSGRKVTYQYDHAGRPLTAADQTTSYVTAATYLPFGPLTSMTLGNGTIETRTFDQRYQPLTSSLTAGAVTLAQYTYTTDPSGNITAIADGTNAGYSRTFGYDDLHRLITANTGSALWGTGAFTYDAMGNMLSATLGAVHRAFSHQGTTPKIDTATGLAGPMTYDAAGNELNSPAGNPAAVYSPRNLLSAQLLREYDRCSEERGSACIQRDLVQVWRSNVYDGRGVRVASTDVTVSQTIGDDPPSEPALYFYTPELAMLNVAAPSTGRKADVIWFGLRPVADHDGSTVRYTFTDHLGTPILQTSAAAAIVWRAEYEPFGNLHTLRAGLTTDDQPLRFPGQQVASTTAAGEESYNVFRWYRAGWGRYTQADPDEITRLVQPYGYALQKPTMKSDPSGLSATAAGPLWQTCQVVLSKGLSVASAAGVMVLGLLLVPSETSTLADIESAYPGYNCSDCTKTKKEQCQDACVKAWEFRYDECSLKYHGNAYLQQKCYAKIAEILADCMAGCEESYGTVH